MKKLALVALCLTACTSETAQQPPPHRIAATTESHGPLPGRCYCGNYEDWDLEHEDGPLHLCIKVQWCFEENPHDARVDWSWDRGCTGNSEHQWGGPMHDVGAVDDFEVPGSAWNGWDPDGEWVIYNSDAAGNLLGCVSVDRPDAEEPVRQCFPLKPCDL